MVGAVLRWVSRPIKATENSSGEVRSIFDVRRLSEWHAEDGMPSPRAVSCSIAVADNYWRYLRGQATQ
ncbi:hypothetical protein GKO32_09850 [Amycolatopsis sp. RM579]|uniref:Uncharacterized protein n=1 Tax=Amycolatopsis pithecellobii TaxID=664692 RepID=A0A6N7YMT2_9PSEU|nr:hypothetical protein [Amycolatopsis pithecellobii]